MTRSLLWLGLGTTFLAGCNDSLGPRLQGRWAATGIELIASGEARELRIACNRPARLPWMTRLDEEGRLHFSGSFGNSITSYLFTFSGQVRGDTLAATLTSHTPDGPTFTHDYLMTADGDPEFERLLCVG
ncbi:MAG: hypothetical protein Q8Q14_02425 [Gemmatimonadales bacterium]|nr:hypothetical protein [Gemmatimonadales bacterium]